MQNVPRHGARLWIARLLQSATFWFLFLAVVGAIVMTAGVVIIAGLGWGLLLFGVLCVLAANAIRQGVMRA